MRRLRRGSISGGDSALAFGMTRRDRSATRDAVLASPLIS